MSLMMSAGAVQARGGIRRQVKHVVELIETLVGAWGRMDCRMGSFPAVFSRSFDELHADIICVLVKG